MCKELPGYTRPVAIILNISPIRTRHSQGDIRENAPDRSRRICSLRLQ